MFKKASKLLLLGGLVVLFTLFLSPENKENEIINHEEKVTKEDIYIVKADENSVFLFKNDNVIKKYDIDIRLLPGSDIKRLTEGIRVDSESAADRLAEDYDG